MRERECVRAHVCVCARVGDGLQLAEAFEGGRICFMRVIDALLQEKRPKQA